MTDSDSEEEMELPVIKTRTASQKPPTLSGSMGSGLPSNHHVVGVPAKRPTAPPAVARISNIAPKIQKSISENVHSTPTAPVNRSNTTSISSPHNDYNLDINNLRQENERLRGLLTLFNSRLDLIELNQRKLFDLNEEVTAIKEALNESALFTKKEKSILDKSSLLPLLQKGTTSDASEILDLIENDKSIYHSGWMNKKGRKVRNWKRRFFVLKGNKLSYYAKETDKTPLGDINLETCMIDELKEREESGRPCMALLVEGRKLLFCAETAEENRKWYLYLVCKNAELSYLRKLKHTNQMADNTLLGFLEQPRSREIKLDNNTLSIDSIVALTGPVRSHDMLTNISLRYANLNDLAIQTLGEAIKVSNTIERLDLEGNQITSDGAKSLSSVISATSSLKVLILKENKIGDEGAMHIANILQQGATKLEQLDLTHNNIHSRGAISLANALVFTTTIPDVMLDDNRIGNEGVTALMQLCQKNSTIFTLRLQNNNITQPGIFAIAEALKVNTSLKRLYLSYNTMDLDAYKAIIKTLMINHSLQCVEFGDYRLETTDLCSLRLLHQCNLLNLS